MHVTCSRSLVLLWRRCYNLCTSGFVNVVMFAHTGQECAKRKGRIYVQSDSPKAAVERWQSLMSTVASF